MKFVSKNDFVDLADSMLNWSYLFNSKVTAEHGS